MPQGKSSVSEAALAVQTAQLMIIGAIWFVTPLTISVDAVYLCICYDDHVCGIFLFKTI